MEALFAWLEAVPPAVLYALAFAATFVEGLLPPTPGDAVAAFLSFRVARTGGSVALAATALTLGSLGGAVTMWALGRRFGAEWMTRLFARLHWAKAEQRAEVAEGRFEGMYRRYGWVALVLSRFLPGVRGAVPAIAGAMRLPLWEIVPLFTLASMVWYGVLAWLAFRVGADWETLRDAIAEVTRRVGIGAVIAAGVLVVVVVWRVRRRRGSRP